MRTNSSLGLLGSAALSMAVAACVAANVPRTSSEQGLRTPAAARPAPVGRPAATARPSAAAPAPALVSFPNTGDSLKFAVLGDFGTGSKAQYALARRMAAVHETFPFELVVLVGDNIYGSDRPQDYKRKFEEPYKPLLDAGVKFYGALGNHDAREQRFYKLFNMDGKLFYSFKAPRQDVRFVALETTYMEPEQEEWVKKTLESSREEWKIVFQHHPLYSSGITHGSDTRLRKVLEPVFVQNGVDVVLTGHDHFYERAKPQQDITYFVTGSGGKLRPGDFRPNQPFSARINDDTNVFLAVEIVGDRLVFNAIATDGTIVDSGEIRKTDDGRRIAGGASSQRSGR